VSVGVWSGELPLHRPLAAGGLAAADRWRAAAAAARLGVRLAVPPLAARSSSCHVLTAGLTGEHKPRFKSPHGK